MLALTVLHWLDAGQPMGRFVSRQEVEFSLSVAETCHHLRFVPQQTCPRNNLILINVVTSCIWGAFPCSVFQRYTIAVVLELCMRYAAVISNNETAEMEGLWRQRRRWSGVIIRWCRRCQRCSCRRPDDTSWESVKRLQTRHHRQDECSQVRQVRWQFSGMSCRYVVKSGVTFTSVENWNRQKHENCNEELYKIQHQKLIIQNKFLQYLWCCRTRRRFWNVMTVASWYKNAKKKIKPLKRTKNNTLTSVIKNVNSNLSSEIH